MMLVAATTAFILYIQRDIFVNRWRASMEAALPLYAGTAAQEYAHNNLNALNAYLERLETTSGIHGLFLDAGGMTVTGRSPHLPKSLVDQALSSGKPEFASFGLNDYALMRIAGSQGQNYLFMVRRQRGPENSFLKVRMNVLTWALAALLVSGLICYLLTNYLTRPVLNLRGAARKLAAGDLTARAGPAMGIRHDEIGELVQDFDRMAERIEELVNSERQLISDISHELRSPLARLNVALGLARQRARAEAGAQLDRIELEAERLNELIGKLLTLARMQTASSPPEKEPVDLHELLSEIAADADFEAQERGCGVRLTDVSGLTSTPPSGPRRNGLVLGSTEILHSAVENVVRNAVRYTAPGSTVEITLSCQDGWAAIDVRDCGPGVPEVELAKLFLPFYRLAGARERQTGGAGLGLAIAERAVRLHGGNIQARNLAGSGGLQVEIRLPLEK